MSKIKDYDLEDEFNRLYDYIYIHHHDVIKEINEINEKMIEEARVKFVGEEYKNPPRDTLPELTMLLKLIDKDLKTKCEMNYSKHDLEPYEKDRNEVFEKIKNKDFIKHTEIDDLRYKEEYEKLHKKFYKSHTYSELLKAIKAKKIEIFKKYVDPSEYPLVYRENVN